MTSFPAFLAALSLAFQDPASTPSVCPPKTTTCAHDVCVPIGETCPSASEVAVAAGETLAPAAPASAEPDWSAPQSAYRSEKLASRRSHRSADCIEPLVDFERRKFIRRLGFMLPGFAALGSSVGFLFAARTQRVIGEAADANLEALGLEPVGDLGLRGPFLGASAVFGAVGLGLIIGGLVSADRMKRAGGMCTASGCTFALRF